MLIDKRIEGRMGSGAAEHWRSGRGAARRTDLVRQTTAMQLTDKQEAAKSPSWIRVQDCAIVAISTPSRYACPDGKVYTGTELYQSRSGS